VIIKRPGTEPGRLTGRHLQEHSSDGTSASKDGTSLLGNSGTSELVWAGLDWGTSSVWNVAGGSVDRVDRGGGCDRVDGLDWDRGLSGHCDGACLSISGAVGDRGGGTGNNWLGWGAAGLHAGWVVGLLLDWADGGRDGDHGGDDLGALVWAVGDIWGTARDGVAGGRVDSAGGVHWVVWGAGGAAHHWLGWGAGAVVGGAGAGALGGACWVVHRRAGGGRGGGCPIIGNNGGGSSAGEDNWSETHLD